jgi:hypothetical protein
MNTLNRDAMTLPTERLVAALRDRITAKQSLVAERDRRDGKDRINVGSYMENLGWPDLFGYDMNRFLSDPEFMLETELRQRIFWADNSDDDWVPNLQINATVGMYYDITMFGQKVWHEPSGVPQFAAHPIQDQPDLSLIPALDFHSSGVMPDLLRQHAALLQLNRERYGGALVIGFPGFGRGPLDVAIQLRGYENFVQDTMERPEFVHALLTRIVEERAAWNRARRRYLGESEPTDPQTGVDDDWVNIPLLSPQIIRDFALPAYRKIVGLEGRIVHFHTCGRLEAVVVDLLKAFQGITWLDVSGWNDFELLDDLVDPKLSFGINFKNTFVLTGTPAQQRAVLERIAQVRKRRYVFVCAQAIVKLHPTYEENLARMNAFIALARQVFAEKA